MQRLQLTDTQIKMLDMVDADTKPVLEKLREGVARLTSALQAILAGESLEDKTVFEQADLLIAARSQLERIDTSRTLALRKILSVGQWATLQKILRPPGG